MNQPAITTHSPEAILTELPYKSTDSAASHASVTNFPITDDLPDGALKRFDGNPVLYPVKEHPWESKYVFNAGSIQLDNKVYLLYRAYGDDEVSRIGLAISEDGFNFTERLDRPIFEPVNETEAQGCEDPRLTLIDDRIYMTYTAWDGELFQIGMASIGVREFKDHRWDSWHRHGMVLPNCENKDAVIFPQNFNGKFALIHRVKPSMWITFASHLGCPWSGKWHKVLATPKAEWESDKIGAGAQPIKTEYGWLLITHGVDRNQVYRLGVMLLDLADPSRLIYRSPNPVLEPLTEWEIGRNDTSWVPNVVFTCGAVPRQNHREALTGDDELLVYYGAADTVICVATAQVGELIPEEIRSSG